VVKPRPGHRPAIAAAGLVVPAPEAVGVITPVTSSRAEPDPQQEHWGRLMRHTTRRKRGVLV
jgi:hypothetical protein